MGIVVIFWILLAVIVAIQLGAIIYDRKYGKKKTIYSIYTNETKENTKRVMSAIKTKVIKKHLLTNSAEKYDSRKALEQYRNFLTSELMSDMMQIGEERYHG